MHTVRGTVRLSDGTEYLIEHHPDLTETPYHIVIFRCDGMTFVRRDKFDTKQEMIAQVTGLVGNWLSKL